MRSPCRWSPPTSNWKALASAQLLVRGYKGNTLGGLLPEWQTFGVDSYGQYMTAISALQKQIMEDAGNI